MFLYKPEKQYISMRKDFIIFVVLLSIFLTIGCTSTNNSPTQTPTQTPTANLSPSHIEPTYTTATPVEISQNTTPKTVEVNISGFAFGPSSVQISVGDSVLWLNLDSVPHQVHCDNFDSGLLRHGYTYSYTFTKPGTYNYICSIHPSMQGTVIVA
jgi:plastocyanin